MAATVITFTESNGQFVCSLTIARATKIHIENGGGRTSFHAKLSGGSRYDEIRDSARYDDTICETIEDKVYPFDLQIRCETRPSLAFKEEEEQ